VSVALGLVVGLLAVRTLVAGGRHLLAAPSLQRRNHRGVMVPTAGGLFAVLAVLAVEAGRTVFVAFGVGAAPAAGDARVLVLFACMGFALLGLFDDLVGDEHDRGLRGHLGALTAGRVTTGAVKLGAGAALALVLVRADVEHGSAARFIADAALVALAANLANLFDRAPGRCLKISLLAWIPLAIAAGSDAVGVALASVVGAFGALLGDDLREHVMLGDTGAYALGGALGLGVVLECSPTTRTVVLVILVAFTVAAELVSFGRVIDRVPVLRGFDQLGRHRS
jgi:UDP-N-acetylmuramyl pentapeptide phosphotransferase/UDP-N-acetylglucosamine-1-phosphate transferase